MFLTLQSLLCIFAIGHAHTTTGLCAMSYLLLVDSKVRRQLSMNMCISIFSCSSLSCLDKTKTISPPRSVILIHLQHP